MEYKIFTTNGDYTNEDGPHTGDKARDVQVILQHDPESGPYFQSSSDYYVWRDGRWWGVDIFGLYDFLLETGLVLFGRTVTNQEYREVYQRANVEKHTWRPGERKP